jgi:hypothetical protein
LRDFRAPGFLALPAVPASLLDGKERVDEEYRYDWG